MLQQLLQDSQLYLDVFHVSNKAISAGVELTDTGEKATLVVTESLQLEEGLTDPAFVITMTSNLLHKALLGEVDLFALGSRSHIDDKKPVDFTFLDKSRIKESIELIYRLGVFFFVPGLVKFRRINLELAGIAHGANPIPLIYWNDLRTAWYHIPEGLVLNEAGEKDPYPQAFIVLRGNELLVLGNQKLAIQPGTTYYIPRDSTHQIHADEAVELIWIAWNAPMNI
jgi:mannose-6-phosphate isomerase-like protein (cupin superfamily)